MTRTASRGREVAERRGAPEGGISRLCILIGPLGNQGGGGDGGEEGGGAASSPSRESEQLLGVESFIGFKK